MEPKAEREITIVEFLSKGIKTVRFLFSKWFVILLAAFVFGLTGILYAWFKKPLYTAEMSFVTETDSKVPISSYAGLAAQFGIDIGGGSNNLFEGENLIELLRSKTMVIQTLLSSYNGSKDDLMIHHYLRIHKLDSKGVAAKIDFSLYEIKPNRYRDSVLKKVADQIIKKDLYIGKRDKKLSIIDIAFTSIDEIFAKEFTESLANNAIKYYTDYKVRKSRQNVAILERQTDSVRNMLFGSIGDVAAITDLNVNPIRQSAKTGSQKRQVDVQANGALYAELVKNLELSRLSLRRETPLIQVIDKPVLPLRVNGIGRFFAGIIAAFIGGILTIFILLFVRWLRSQQERNFTIKH